MSAPSRTQWSLLAQALGAAGELVLYDGNADRTARALQGRGLLHRADTGRWRVTLAGLQALLDHDRHAPARYGNSPREVLAKLVATGSFTPTTGGEGWAADQLVRRGAATRRGDILTPTALGRQQGARELVGP